MIDFGKVAKETFTTENSDSLKNSLWKLVEQSEDYWRMLDRNGVRDLVGNGEKMKQFFTTMMSEANYFDAPPLGDLQHLPEPIKKHMLLKIFDVVAQLYDTEMTQELFGKAFWKKNPCLGSTRNKLFAPRTVSEFHKIKPGNGNGITQTMLCLSEPNCGHNEAPHKHGLSSIENVCICVCGSGINLDLNNKPMENSGWDKSSVRECVKIVVADLRRANDLANKTVFSFSELVAPCLVASMKRRGNTDDTDTCPGSVPVIYHSTKARKRQVRKAVRFALKIAINDPFTTHLQQDTSPVRKKRTTPEKPHCNLFKRTLRVTLKMEKKEISLFDLIILKFLQMNPQLFGSLESSAAEKADAFKKTADAFKKMESKINGNSPQPLGQGLFDIFFGNDECCHLETDKIKNKCSENMVNLTKDYKLGSDGDTENLVILCKLRNGEKMLEKVKSMLKSGISSEMLSLLCRLHFVYEKTPPTKKKKDKITECLEEMFGDQDVRQHSRHLVELYKKHMSEAQ